ncbi:hypothetical protein GF376_04835, partial [Candidatus Peregrinibacteria bacterium]|nr:hypothetical protein [Candidatus Peregrinibacteria bacterium]
MKTKNFIIPIAILTLFPHLVFSQSDTNIFPDVKSTHINSRAIDYLKNEGIVEGYPDGEFKPQNSI